MDNQEKISNITKQSERTKKDSKKIIVPIVVILIFLVALFAIYNFVFCNSKSIFLRAINSEYQKLDDKLNKITNSDLNTMAKNKAIKANYTFDIDINADDIVAGTNYEGLIDEINKLNFEMNTGVDNKNKKFSYNIKANYEQDNLINAFAYGQKEKIYIELKDLFDKYIEVPVKEYDTIFESSENLEDSKYIVKTVKDSFLNNLNEKEFIKTSTKTDINGKNKAVKKITYSLNEKKSLILIKDILTELKENDKFIEKYANISNASKGKVKKDINQAIKKIKSDIKTATDNEKTIEMSVYTEGLLNKVVKYEIRLLDDEEKTALTYSDYKDIITIKAYSDDNVFTSKTVKTSKNTYKTKINMDDFKIVVNSKITKERNSHKFTMTQKDNSDIEVTGEFVTTSKEIEKKKKYNGNLKFNLSIKLDDKKISIDMNGKSVYKVVNNIKIPNDVDNSISYNKLSDNDYTTIMTNLNKNEKLVELISNISKYMNTSDYYTDSID